MKTNVKDRFLNLSGMFRVRFFIVCGSKKSGFRVDAARQVKKWTDSEYVTVEHGFRTKKEAQERASALCLSASSRRARFKLVLGGKG